MSILCWITEILFHLILDFLLEFWINSPKRPVYVQIHLGTAGKHLEERLGAAFQSSASVLFFSS